jgi:hypothetical protein
MARFTETVLLLTKPSAVELLQVLTFKGTVVVDRDRARVFRITGNTSGGGACGFLSAVPVVF